MLPEGDSTNALEALFIHVQQMDWFVPAKQGAPLVTSSVRPIATGRGASAVMFMIASAWADDVKDARSVLGCVRQIWLMYEKFEYGMPPAHSE